MEAQEIQDVPGNCWKPGKPTMPQKPKKSDKARMPRKPRKPSVIICLLCIISIYIFIHILIYVSWVCTLCMSLRHIYIYICVYVDLCPMLEYAALACRPRPYKALPCASIYNSGSDKMQIFCQSSSLFLLINSVCLHVSLFFDQKYKFDIYIYVLKRFSRLTKVFWKTSVCFSVSFLFFV